MNRRHYSSFTIVLLAGLLAVVVSVQAQQGNWNTTGSLSSARIRQTATLLANGKVLVVGGLSVPTPCCRTASSAELYDPATGQWSDAGSPDTPRTNHVAVRLTNGKVLIAGGSTDLINSLSGAGLYDPSTNSWSSAGSLSIARQNAAAVLLPDGRVLITGGLPTNKAGNSTEIYNPATNSWSFGGTMKASRALHSITLLPNGKVLLAGGTGTTNASFTSEIYDTATDNWSLTGELVTPRTNHTAVLLANGQVLAAGGVDSSENSLREAELYDPSTERWSRTGNLTAPRVLHTLTALPNGNALAAGGEENIFTAFKSAELYDPDTGTWKTTSSLNTARLNHTATLLLNGNVLVEGGANLTSSVLSSAELFNSGTPAVTTISAASFVTGQLAPEALAAAFGTGFSNSTQVAAGQPLPTQLAGVTVRIKDRTGAERAAPLLFVSPNQINYQIPPDTATGTAIVTVSTGAVGIVEIARVAPALFTANANGQGVAAAVALRVKADGTQSFEPIAQFDAGQNRFIALPINLGPDAGPATDQVFLVLFGTGIKFRSALSAVTATIGGINSEVTFAGAAPGFTGLDQVNLRLPRSLAGRGEVDLVLTVDGQPANKVRVSIQ